MTKRDPWDQVRAYALAYPYAIEDFPWHQSVIKIDYPPGRKYGNGLAVGPMFAWLGQADVPTPGVSLKLTTAYDEAVALAGATPTTMSGLGQWGWLTIPVQTADLDLVRDWMEESYRNVAPKKLLGQLGPGVG